MTLDIPEYRIVRELGRGAWGVVHEAVSLETGESVALKKVHGASPDDLLSLKREFRRVRSLHHPNLVQLLSLVIRGDDAYFTMELLDGVDLLRFLRGDEEGPIRAERLPELRRCFLELTDALAYLHANGVVHRDLKPANIFADRDGRVVVLDFGLASESSDMDGSEFQGSLYYSPPEVLYGGESSPAADWYAVGVVLADVLLGRPLFQDDVEALLARKLSPHAPSLPDPLGGFRELLVALLEPEPTHRAGAVELRAALSGEREIESTGFVGRENERAALQALLERDSLEVVFIEGPPGIGKSELVRRVLASSDATVLYSRCHPDESVAYRSLDGVVDHLALVLSASDDVPRVDGCEELVALFPVLAPIFDEKPVSLGDPRARRAAGFSALLELLEQLALRRRVVLWIDDLQWSDQDSATFFELLARRRSALALVACHRSEEITSPIEQLHALWPDASRLVLAPLQGDAAQAMARVYVGEDRVADLVRESGGSPWLMGELGRSWQTQGAHATSGDPMGGAYCALEEDVRELLDLVLVGGALTLPVLRKAADGPMQLAFAHLESRRFVRRTARGTIETWHDRVRESLEPRIEDGARRELHGRLADAWQAIDEPPPRTVARHLRSAGRGAASVPWYRKAAVEAEQQLAFEQAADDYSHALAQSQTKDTALLLGLARATDNAGRSLKAASLYTDVASRVDLSDAERLELQLLAATRYLYGGELDLGWQRMRSVMDHVGLGLPRWPILSALTGRVALLFAGREPRVRSPGSREAHRVLRVEALLGVVKGTVMVSPAVSDALAVRALREALVLGDPGLVLRTMGLEAVSEAAVGGRFLSRRAAQLLAIVRRLCADEDSAYSTAWDALCSGCVSFFQMRLDDAVTQCTAALEGFTRRCVGATHEMNVSASFTIAALAVSGRVKELTAILPELRDSARRRGDLYAGVVSHTAETFLVALAREEPEVALEEADAALAAWPGEDFGSPQYQHLFAVTSCLLYMDRAAEAEKLLEAGWPLLEKAQYLRMDWLGRQLDHLRGRVALQVESVDARTRRSRIAQSIKRLRASSLAPCEPLADCLEAARAAIEGDAERAASLLEGAVTAFDRAGLRLHREAARMQAGRLCGRHDQIDAASAWMNAEGIAAPDKMARLLVPIALVR